VYISHLTSYLCQTAKRGAALSPAVVRELNVYLLCRFSAQNSRSSQKSEIERDGCFELFIREQIYIVTGDYNGVIKTGAALQVSAHKSLSIELISRVHHFTRLSKELGRGS
jgi:hypothetical protein